MPFLTCFSTACQSLVHLCRGCQHQQWSNTFSSDSFMLIEHKSIKDSNLILASIFIWRAFIYWDLNLKMSRLFCVQMLPICFINFSIKKGYIAVVSWLLRVKHVSLNWAVYCTLVCQYNSKVQCLVWFEKMMKIFKMLLWYRSPTWIRISLECWWYQMWIVIVKASFIKFLLDHPAEDSATCWNFSRETTACISLKMEIDITVSLERGIHWC